MLRNPGLRKSVEQPVLDLNFAASQIGSNGAPDGRMNDFNRGSNAWFVDSDGLVKKSPHNLQVYSQDFDNAAWSKSRITVSANATTAPDGTLTADKIVETEEGGAKYWRDFASAVTGERYFFSVFAKAGERKYLQMWTAFGTGGFFPEVWNIFDVEAGTITRADPDADSVTIEDVGDGWFRCTTSITADGTGLDDIGFGLWDGVGSIPTQAVSYTGDGSSGLFVWGAQFSHHSTAPVGNPYIKTEGSEVYAARLDHDPSWFMSEAQEQNLLEYSEMLDDSYWTKSAVNVTANAETDPLGGTTAEYVYASSPSGIFPAVIVEFDVAKGVVHTLSFYAKKGERDQIHVDNQNPGPVFNENVISNAELTSEWQRFTGTFTPDENTSRLAFYFGSGAKTWSGDQGFYLWGLQVEVGSTASTYHRTEGAPYYGPGATPKGLLIEEARTNLITGSESATYFDTFVQNVTQTADAALAPDGTTTAVEMLETSDTGDHLMTKNVTVADNAAICFSYFVKANGRTTGAIEFYGAGGIFTTFDLSAGTIVAGTPYDSGTNGFAGIEDYGNGWFRVHTGLTTKSGDTSGTIQIRIRDDGTNSYAGDTTKGLYVWGFQVEQGTFPTSYIQTTGNTKTRNADVAVMGPTTGGTELVTNGTFDTDVSNWVEFQANSSITFSSGAAIISSNQYNDVRQVLSLVEGRRYRASMDVITRTSGAWFFLLQHDSTLSFAQGSFPDGSTQTFDFTAGAVNTLRIYPYTTTNPDTIKVDNVSVRELYPFEQYNPAEGTLVAEGELIGSGSNFASLVALYQEDADDTHFINTFWDSSNSIIKTSVKDTTSQGSPTPSVGGDTWGAGDSFYTANLYKENSLNLALDGYIGTDDTSATIPGVDQLGIFQASINFQSTKHSGYMKRVTYYNRRISNIAAQNLTSD